MRHGAPCPCLGPISEPIRSIKMKGPATDHVGELLSTLADQLAADPGELGVKALRVWSARSPELIELGGGDGGDSATTSTGFMAILLGSLLADVELDWRECEERARDYGRRRAVQDVPLESLIDELSVYRRTAIELISAPLQGSALLEKIVALAQSRLDDVTDHLNQSMAAGYVDQVEAEHRAGLGRTRHLPTLGAVAGRRACDAAAAAGSGLRKMFGAARFRALWLKQKSVQLTDETRRVVRLRPRYIEI